jgi:hypothetical protein
MDINHWQETPLEMHVKWLLHTKLRDGGRALWTKYESLRDEVVRHVLPWIATQETTLTDHGVNHIRDVMGNAALLIGLKNEFGADCEREVGHGFTHCEMLVLLCGLLTHDIGNILGRNRHNLNISAVWSKLNSWRGWSPNDRQLIVSVGRAHTGISPEGTKDTLKPLELARFSFEKQPVQAAAIAAVIRFADELAEGPQRTSLFLLENNLIEKDSEIYHHYAEITEPACINQANGRIALNYHLHIDNDHYPINKRERKKYVTKLLSMIYSRAAKLNFERRFTRHYASVLVPFKETSVSLNFYNKDEPIDLNLRPITLNDFGPGTDSLHLIEKTDSTYQINNLINLAFGDGNA